MEGFIFRVETLYGTCDYDTLKEAKEQSKENDHIQLVAPDGLTVLSRVRRKYATPSWACKILGNCGFKVEQRLVFVYNG